MLLPKDLISESYERPDIYLCETNKERMCRLETIDTKATLKFNAYSELSFTVPRLYDDLMTGEQKINPFYDKIEALRLIFVQGFGYFEIQESEIESDGIREVKNVTAYSLEYSLSQKYLENFYINTGEMNSVEVIYADTHGTALVPVSLYNPILPELSLLHLILEKIYGWKIGHVDMSLRTMCRTFEISRESVYDFMMNDICEKFNCFFVFDTVENTINVYAESLISKFIGDGSTTVFTLVTPYDSIDTVTIDSYKTTAYTYDPNTGILTFDTPPADGAKIEVTDGTQAQWATDVYVSFDNLAQEVNVSYSADDIKTVLTVKGSEDLDIREVNFGLPYITDLSYYYTVDWMGQDLYDAYTAYLQKCNSHQAEYKENAQEMIEVADKISYEENRLSLQYSIATVSSTTIGTYYVRGGTAPNYYYIEVSLPKDYNANVEHYYTLSGNDLTEEKFSRFYEALKIYYNSQDSKDTSKISELKDDFAFMETNTIDSLVSALSGATSTEQKDTAVKTFLNEMWNQLGLTPLKTMYQKSYIQIRDTNIEAGWSDASSQYYWLYYPVTVVLKSIDDEILERQATIDEYQEQYDVLKNRNNEISNQLIMTKNFTEEQLVRLSPFLREDEYIDDNFVETSYDSTDEIIKLKQELLECGRIELAKLCEPKLEFSMDMANIFALEEFAPIVGQFQLGNLINVVIRSDYIKRARLLQVDINFDDFSDFSCEFGELTNLKTPSNIHADLLSNAIQAGKSVASQASYWTKGSDLANDTYSKIQDGLLDATEGIYSSTQGVVIDRNGIHLTKIINEETGEVSPLQAWIINNNILFSSDGFKTSETALGEFTLSDGRTFYGLLAQAVLAGYIESSSIVGGTIRIGDRTDGTYNFEVDENGTVTIRGIVNGKTLLDWTHPVGSIYQSTISTSPEELFGGTWEQLSGRFLLASNSTYAAGSTGGEATHTLTIDEMPSHEGHLDTNETNLNGNNNLYLPTSVFSSYGTNPRGWATQADNEVVPAGESKGGGQAHNNMPPYLAVYMWKRTA